MFLNRQLLLAQDVEGFLTNREGQMLYALASKVKPQQGAIVEIGSWKGKSTIWITQALKDHNLNIPFFAIDPHIGSSEHQHGSKKVWTFDQFKNNLMRNNLIDLVTPIIQTSQAARSKINTPIQMLFIDGAHEYEFVDLDYRLWSSAVCEGGVIAFHDTPWPGVKRVIEHVFTHDGFKNVYFTDCLMVGTKTSSASAKDRFKNRLMLKANALFQQGCSMKAPKIIRTLLKNIAKAFRSIISWI